MDLPRNYLAWLTEEPAHYNTLHSPNRLVLSRSCRVQFGTLCPFRQLAGGTRHVAAYGVAQDAGDVVRGGFAEDGGGGPHVPHEVQGNTDRGNLMGGSTVANTMTPPTECNAILDDIGGSGCQSVDIEISPGARNVFSGTEATIQAPIAVSRPHRGLDFLFGHLAPPAGGSSGLSNLRRASSTRTRLDHFFSKRYCSAFSKRSASTSTPSGLTRPSSRARLRGGSFFFLRLLAIRHSVSRTGVSAAGILPPEFGRVQ